MGVINSTTAAMELLLSFLPLPPQLRRKDQLSAAQLKITGTWTVIPDVDHRLAVLHQIDPIFDFSEPPKIVLPSRKQWTNSGGTHPFCFPDRGGEDKNTLYSAELKTATGKPSSSFVQAIETTKREFSAITRS